MRQVKTDTAFRIRAYAGMPIMLVHCLQVYTGGVGSFALLVMVASFLLLHPSRRSAGYAGAGAGETALLHMEAGGVWLLLLL